MQINKIVACVQNTGVTKIQANVNEKMATTTTKNN